ncbi:hypothetical protein DM02DRAFT_658815 [Periconia macrospinosa]|uniref:Uncharacterized protein n=1 Tax=Periconia macrospinosa TaxID=97972 RepID=A0A2V1DFF4_9PLEO|nr:hypothetical protein DM02DRAFT_658815 [Periconia macrospinosa]
MAESIEEFFADDRLTDSNLRNSAVCLRKCLEGKTTTQDTAQSIMDTAKAVSLSEVLDECIIRAAEQLPESHYVLTELVIQLRSQHQHISEEVVTKFDHYLIMSFGERWARYGDPDPQDAWKEQARTEWINLNHFVALLFSAGVNTLSNFGEQSLKMTLKRGSWRVNWTGQENTSDSIIALEGHAMAAANWIIVSGRQLYENCSDVRTEFATLHANLTWIIELDGLNSDIKSKLQEAKTTMDKIRA